MSDQIGTALRDFINNEKLRVLAITSPWGKGKTYRWKEWRKAFQNERNISPRVPRHVTYASLFGVKDIDEVYLRLTANIELLHGKPSWGQRFWRWTRIPYLYQKSGLRRAQAIFRDIELTAPGFRLKTARIWAEAARTSLKNSLVCLDDLERKQPELPATVILGLIDELVAQRGCRVVLIYNDDKLVDAERSAITAYSEKVIDRHVCYAPSLADLRRVVWKDDAPSEVRDVLEQASVDNIRVLRLIDVMLNYFKPTFSAFPMSWSRFQEQATRLAILHYCYPEIVSIEALDVADLASIYMEEKNASKQSTPENQAADRARKGKLDCLKRVGYQYARPTDALVVGFLKQGYADFEGVNSMLGKLEQGEIASMHKSSEANFWSIYHSNFTVDGQKWVDDFVQFAEIHYEYLSLRDIDYMAQFMKEYGLSTHNFEPLLERVIKRRAQEIFEERHADTYIPSEDSILRRLAPAVLKRLNDELARLRGKSPWTPIRALEATSSPGQGWNDHDLEVLKKLTQSEWAAFLKAETHPELISLLGEFFDRHGKTHRGVADLLMAALEQEIAPISKFDEIRVGHLKKRYLAIAGTAQGQAE